ncbi:MAG TPA: STAS domain-containing protein [Streptomyces sp.]|nr:STAS domain-containing protein [Streptomyces sp.]
MSIAQNPLSVEVTLPREDVALLRVQGYLDVDTTTDFQHHLANQLHHGRRHFLLDLSAVPFMDSSGMNIILRVYQQARDLPGSVHVISPTPAVRRILDLTGVSLTVPVSESVEEALERVDRGPGTAEADGTGEADGAVDDADAADGTDGPGTAGGGPVS